jgi:hypothetical protein
MEHRDDLELSIIYGRRFGHIAVTKGFVSINQVQEALAEQMTCSSFRRLRPRRLIGEILFEKGWITLEQIEKVLADITEEKSHYM